MADHGTPTAFAASLGLVVRQERELHGWTLRDFHDRTGISKTYLLRIEHGRVENVGLATIFRIAEAFGDLPAWAIIKNAQGIAERGGPAKWWREGFS